MEEPLFRQLAAAPELRSSSSARVTTTTTLPASKPIDDACSEERIEPIAEEADMRETHSAPRDRYRQARFSSVSSDNFITIRNC